MRRFLVTLFLFVVGTTISFAQDEEQLTIWTEEYPPYNYSDNGTIQGMATELVVEILSCINSELTREDIRLVPWARGYANTLNHKNNLIYSITRSTHREDLFKWVCPVGSGVIGLIGRKDKHIVINTPKDMEKYRIGVVREDIGHQLMLKVLPEKELDISNSSGSNLLKLNQGRIDLFAYDTSVADFVLKHLELDSEEYETLYILDEAPLCIAFNKDTDDAIVETFQKALNRILAERNTDTRR